jgi:hypothetical protein
MGKDKMNSAAKAIQNEIAKREREIEALKTALAALSSNGTAPASGGKRRGRKPLTPAQKKAISQAMKAAWKKRKAAEKKAEG